MQASSLHSIEIKAGKMPALQPQIERREMNISKNWETPQTAQDAMSTLEKLSALLQFVKDLTTQGGPSEEYEFTDEGYYGLYYFPGFVQDITLDCHKAIHNNFKTEREVN